MKLCPFALTLFVAAFSLSLSACGGSNATTTPPPTYYTIGGTVSGLSGLGLALQDNETDNLSVSKSGNFTFAMAVASGKTYNATILTQPSHQSCVVSNGSGTALADVTNIQVTCVTSKQPLYSFGNPPDGEYPSSHVVFDTAGNLYGTTVQGGAYGYGTVFRLRPGQESWTETVIYDFCPSGRTCQDGGTPYSSLALDAAGDLYGTTSVGGAFGGGVAFKLTPSEAGPWTETVLHSFGSNTDGASPLAGMVFDGTGNLYGTTSSGGTTFGPVCPDGCGVIFELSPGSGGQWTEKVLHQFCSETGCADGANPTAGLILDASGNLYGTTLNGGAPYDYGTVFELTPADDQWTETVLHAFEGGQEDGYNPHAGVVQDKSGSLYGTTESGYETLSGVNNGTVFKLTPAAGGQWAESVIYGFCTLPNCTDGTEPLAELVLDAAGDLYGTTFSGGNSNWGVVFELIAQGSGQWVETFDYSFVGGADGFNPNAGLALDATGNLYGVAPQGGTYGNGVVFEIEPGPGNRAWRQWPAFHRLRTGNR